MNLLNTVNIHALYLAINELELLNLISVEGPRGSQIVSLSRLIQEETFDFDKDEMNCKVLKLLEDLDRMCPKISDEPDAKYDVAKIFYPHLIYLMDNIDLRKI